MQIQVNKHNGNLKGYVVHRNNSDYPGICDLV